MMTHGLKSRKHYWWSEVNLLEQCFIYFSSGVGSAPDIGRLNLFEVQLVVLSHFVQLKFCSMMGAIAFASRLSMLFRASDLRFIHVIQAVSFK